FRSVHQKVEIIPALELVGGIALHIGIAQVEFDEVGAAQGKKTIAVVIAHRNAPRAAKAKTQHLFGPRLKIVGKEIVVFCNGAGKPGADELVDEQRREALSRTEHGDVGGREHVAASKRAGSDQALAEVLAVDELALAEGALIRGAEGPRGCR